MSLYGIRSIYNGDVQSMCVLAETEMSGETEQGLSSKRYVEISAGISLTTFRKALFISADVNFVCELFLTGSAIDYEEYFEFSDSDTSTTYEVYNAITNERVEIDLYDPSWAELKEIIERRLELEGQRLKAKEMEKFKKTLEQRLNHHKKSRTK